MTPLEAAYKSANERMGLTYEQFSAAVDGWQVIPVDVAGELAGAVLVSGPEIHACILPQFFRRWLSRRVLRDTLQAVLAEHGYAITRAATEDGDKFIKRLGFTKIADADGVATYRLEAKHGH